jgi:hypothetical protein
MVLKETDISHCLMCYKLAIRKRLIYSQKFKRYVCCQCYNKNPVFYKEDI